MISVSTGADHRYYVAATDAPHENYYTSAVVDGEPAGRWAGRGAAALGLKGDVSAQGMEALYAHRLDPRDDRFADRTRWGEAPTIGGPPRRYATAEETYVQLLAAEPNASGERREVLRLNAERSARSNVQYIDVTFSVQKSVTVLHAAFERQLVEAERAGDGEAADAWRAHRNAVEAAMWAGNAAALDFLQDEAGYARIGHHGGAAGRYVDAHDWVITSFLQHDSRDGDPQLHIHNPILNLAESADGRWLTLNSRGIHRHRRAAAALAERVTEEHLARALGVRFVTRPDGKAREIIGVRAAVMELFSSRRRKIMARAEGLVAEFTARYGRRPNALELDRLQRRATMATRRSKSHDAETTAQRLDRWDAELRAEVADGLAGVAYDVLGLVDQAREPDEWSPSAVVETALADVQAGQATWTRPDLFRSVSDALPDHLGGLAPQAISDLFDQLTDAALAHPSVQQVAGERDGDRPVVGELLLADGSSSYAAPAGARYALAAHLDGERALRRAAVERGAPALDVDQAARLADESDMDLDPGQRRALIGILTSSARLETLTGPAGTGKSTVVGGLARIWSDPATWGGGSPRVVGLAASQVATDVLTAEGLTSRNVTRWLNVQDRLAAGSAVEDDANWELASGDLLVVDEAAMLPTADLIAVHAHAERAGAKLLLTGDHRQLAAVGAGGGMALLAAAGGHELIAVHRFTAEWEGPASLRLREGDEQVLHAYRQHGRLIDGGTPDQARASATRAWLADTLAGHRSVLVVGTNEDAALASAEIRAELVRLGRVAEDGVRLGRDGTTAGVGDLVQARRNGWELAGWSGNSRAPINRETYRTVETRDDGGLVVEPVDGKHAGTRLTLPSSYVDRDLTLGYAGTVHSTQGRTVDTAHIVAGAGSSSEALYVGMTRGRHGNHAHVITRPADAAQPVGAAHSTKRGDPLGVLAGVVTAELNLSASATQQADDDDTRRASVQTAIERFAAEAEMVYTARTAAALDRLTVDGVLTSDQRQAFAANSADTGSLARLLRTAELAGHDPDRVLAAAVTSRDFEGALSLPQVTYRRIERQLVGQLSPTVAAYADMVPAVTGDGWRRQLTAYAEAADARRRELGAKIAADPPQWAAEALGPVPRAPLARLDWEHRAGTVAAWRELTGHSNLADALGAAARPGQPEHHAAWHAAWAALGRPDGDRAEAELTDGQLRLRIRAHDREQNWAPPYVGESLTATALSADTHRRDAGILTARADAAVDPAEADRLRRSAADAEALAGVLADRMRQLETADAARAQWLVHTAVTRDAADRARAELANRGVPLAAEADDRVTATEWLAAHRAEQEESDRNRPITSDYDLADTVISPASNTGPADIREQTPEEFVDEEGRVPDAAQSEVAVRRAQAALAEIEQRRTLDERRAVEERRAQQLNRWAADFGRAAESVVTAER